MSGARERLPSRRRSETRAFYEAEVLGFEALKK